MADAVEARERMTSTRLFGDHSFDNIGEHMSWFLDAHERRQLAGLTTLIEASFAADPLKRLGPYS